MKMILGGILFILIEGCATKPFHLTPSGGSKSDATVEMAYSLGVFRRAIIDWENTDLIAKDLCIKWGFSHATRLNYPKQLCMYHAKDGGCMNYKYTYTYQCTQELNK